MLPARHARVSAMCRAADISLARGGCAGSPARWAGGHRLAATRMRGEAGICYPIDMRSARLLLT